MKRQFTTVLALTLAILIASGPTVGFAQDSAAGESSTQLDEESRAKFKELSSSAQKKFAAGDYDGAIADFEAAYEIKPASNILYNIGRIHEQKGDIDGAIAYYERFVVAPNVEIKARQDAVTRLRTLKEVRDLRDGEAEKVAESEKAEETEKAEEEAPVVKPPPPEPDRTAAWVFLGIGATTLIGSGVFALLTSMQHRDYEDATTLQARRDAASTGKTFGYVSDGLLATGIVTGAIGAVLWFVASPDEEAMAVRGGVGPDGAHVGISWSFE